jgi:hypothetical protein
MTDTSAYPCDCWDDSIYGVRRKGLVLLEVSDRSECTLVVLPFGPGENITGIIVSQSVLVAQGFPELDDLRLFL